MNHLPLFPNLASILSEIDPDAEAERVARDLETAERVEPGAAPMSNARKRAAYRFQAPNLARPLRLSTIEIGLATVSGFGRHSVRFESRFGNTPYALYAAFGFFEVRVPIPRVEWRQFRIGLVRIRIPIPRLEWTTFRLPVMVFMTNVDDGGIEFFNVAGTANVVYFAMGE